MWYSSALFTFESRGGTRTLIRQNSLLSSFSVRSELIVLHSASALAQESAICSQTMEGSRPAAPALSQDRRADGDVRRPGGSARDERSDNSCWRKLRVLTPHESEESSLRVFVLLGVFRFFLVTAFTSAEGTFHSV